MNYAVIKTGGKQYKVSEGDVITVERVETKPNETIIFSEVLLSNLDGEPTFGQPFIPNFTVSGKVLDHIRGEKLRIAKYKAKVRYRRITGHRQELSKIQIGVIGSSKIKKEENLKKVDSIDTRAKLRSRTVLSKNKKKTT